MTENRQWFAIRRPIGQLPGIALGLLCVAVCAAVWWFLTRGPVPERIVSPLTLPSPAETFGEFKSLWFDRALTRNAIVTLRRVCLGFGLAALIGVPLGVLAGCFAMAQAFLAPLIIFGRNIPLAALTVLTFLAFGIGEQQKVMFIFFACVAFVIADVSNAVKSVSMKYVDTAYTLGANRWQVIIKVLVPLAMPAVFGSLRLLFGLAFGYIMLAEAIKLGNESGGLGYLILMSQKRALKEHLYLIVLIIPVIALAIDRFLYWVQRELFPYQSGSPGILNFLVRATMHTWEDFKGLVYRRKLPEHLADRDAAPPTEPT